MSILMREAIRGFELYYPELFDDAIEYYEDSLGYLIVEMRDGRILIYDDETTNLVEQASLNDKKDFATRLRLIMRRRHITQKELSEKSGLSVNTISSYVNGKQLPNYRVACVLADVLECSTDDFRYADPRKRKRLI